MPYTKGGMGPLCQHCPRWRRLNWRTRDKFTHLHEIRVVSDWRYKPKYSPTMPARCWVRDWECSCGHKWVSNFDWQRKRLADE